MLFPKPHEIPVFVMLPLDTVTVDGVFKYAGSAWFTASLKLLADSGAYGVAVDIWWGAVEREPGQYTWSGYRQLFEMIRSTGLRLQVVLSFHACGGNVGDTAFVPLPPWVLRCGENDPDLFFTDRPRGGIRGQRNREYISVWADDVPGVLCGRSPMQCYEDLMISFRDQFSQELGTLIEELVVGSGPCGELRFPSYVEANGWRFPGVGEFQCYDRRALASLAQAAKVAGQAEWGHGGPHDTGDYNSSPEETGFYHHAGSWDSAYGRFFLDWYSGSLVEHADKLMGAASRIFGFAMRRTALGEGVASAQQVLGSASGSASVSKPGSSDAGSDETRTAVISEALMSPQRVGGMPNQKMTRSQPSGLLAIQQSGDGPPLDRLLEVDQSEASGSLSNLDLPTSDMVHIEVASTDSGIGSASGSAGSVPDHITSQTRAQSIYSDCTDLQSGPGSRAGRMEAEGTEQIRQGMAADLLQSNFSLGDAMSLGRETGGDEESIDRLSRRSGMEGDEMQADDGGQPGSSEGMPSTHRLSNGSRGGLTLTLKIAGIHWWFRSRSHAAELTAGYYNTATRDGYGAIVNLCVKHSFSLTITCVEMCDTQHPVGALCGPEGLLKQIRSLCASRGVKLSGENALPIFLLDGVDTTALDRIVYNTRVWPGAAVMAAYLNLPGGSQNGMSISPESTPPSSSHNSIGFFYNGSAGNLAVLQQQNGGWYKHPGGHSSLGDVFSQYRASDNGLKGSRVGVGSGLTPFGSAGGSTNIKGRNTLIPQRSDPAIAATGLRGDSYADISEPLPPMRSFTFLRLAPMIMQPSYQGPWMKFMWKMREGGFC